MQRPHLQRKVVEPGERPLRLFEEAAEAHLPAHASGVPELALVRVKVDWLAQKAQPGRLHALSLRGQQIAARLAAAVARRLGVSVRACCGLLRPGVAILAAAGAGLLVLEGDGSVLLLLLVA